MKTAAPRRAWLWLGVVAFFGLGGAVLLVARLGPVEPVRAGRPLNYWLNQLLTTNRPQAELVMRDSGTNILPILQANLRSEDSILRTSYRKIWPVLPQAAQQYFRPPRSIEDGQEPVYRALCALGLSAVPYLINWMQSGDSNLRRVAIVATRDIGATASAAVPTLVGLIDHSDQSVRDEAAFALACVATSTNGAIPALVRVVERDDIHAKRRGAAAWALARMGTAARPALPALNHLARSTNSYARIYAEIAVWRIDGDTNMIPRLISELENAQDLASCNRILVALEDSKPALEMIRERVRHPDWAGQFAQEILDHEIMSHVRD